MLALVGAGVKHTFRGDDYEVRETVDTVRETTIVECVHASSDREGLVVMNACRLHSNGHTSFAAYEKQVPMDLIVWFVNEANRRLSGTVK